jgi:hypothetical protein
VREIVEVLVEAFGEVVPVESVTDTCIEPRKGAYVGKID